MTAAGYRKFVNKGAMENITRLNNSNIDEATSCAKCEKFLLILQLVCKTVIVSNN